MARLNLAFRLILIISATVFFAGCAGTQVKQRYVWPPPPEEPRIEFLGSYSSQSDLISDNFITAITGKDESTALENPQAIATDGNGKVYVTDMKLAGVMIFDFVARKTTILGGEKSSGLFGKPSGIALDGEGNIYVADTQRRKILVFDKSETPRASIDLSAQLKSIGHIAIDRERKRIIVPDPSAHMVYVVDFSGKVITTLSKYEGEEGVFNRPNAVAVERGGNILVADSLNGHIVRFRPDGKFLSMFGSSGENPGQFAIIPGVAVDSEGHIYVVDAKSNRFNIFSDKGEFLLAIGAYGDSREIIGGFSTPYGICIDQNDTIYIVEKYTKRFQKYQYLNAAYLAKNPINKDELAKPMNIGKEAGIADNSGTVRAPKRK